MEDSKISFSVAMCVYEKDNPDYFIIAVDSILNQTVKPSEVVLVVDGYVPEELEAVIQNYEKNTIFKIIWLERNQGHGKARRIGLENCKYDLVALMDADDISMPDRFEKQLAEFGKNPQICIVGGNISEFIDNPDNIIGKRIVPSRDEEIKEYLKKRCPFNQMTVMFRKKSVQKAGGYRDWYCNEDYYLWIRMMLIGCKMANVSDILVNVRVGKEMYQRRGGMRYFRSEAKLQRYMLQKKIISFPTYTANVLKRIIVQLLLPNRIRGWVFQKFARD